VLDWSAVSRLRVGGHVGAAVEAGLGEYLALCVEDAHALTRSTR
jgi:hypothetical protein